MTKLKNLFRILFFLAIISAVSCEKFIDFLPAKPKNCRIKRVHFIEHSVLDYYGDFYYNKWGNPDSVIFGFVEFGKANMHFKYNNRKQLTQAKYTNSNGSSIESLHKFGYNNGLITTDTTYILPSNEEPVPMNYLYKRISYFEYDDFGRIIKKTVHHVSPVFPPDESTYFYDDNGNLVYFIYTYDENGNLVSSTLVKYDNYTNFRLLHPIWQFLEADYSRNNPFEPISYNNFRLPLKFGPEIPRDGSRFFGRALADIEYDCK